MKLRKYTLNKLKFAVKNSFSIREALMLLNVVAYGGNYRTFKRAIKEFNIDISHFLGKANVKGKRLGIKFPLSDYLFNKRKIISYKLKKRLIKEEIFTAKCYNCNLITWLGEPIPLELHHKDGNHENNRLTNLQLLCPNCHALTDNYRGKNK